MVNQFLNKRKIIRPSQLLHNETPGSTVGFVAETARVFANRAGSPVEWWFGNG
jgi:hypothetical protein